MGWFADHPVRGRWRLWRPHERCEATGKIGTTVLENCCSRLRPCSVTLFGRNCLGQATKSTWGMSWRQEAMKDVEGCDMPGGAVKQALIPGFPNDRTVNQ